MGRNDPVLEYRSPTEEPERPSAAIGLALCAPGLVCWTLLVMGLFGFVRPPTYLVGVIFLLWGLAAITATVSLFLYFLPSKQSRPWYVVLNLAINITGLILSLVLLATMFR